MGIVSLVMQVEFLARQAHQMPTRKRAGFLLLMPCWSQFEVEGIEKKVVSLIFRGSPNLERMRAISKDMDVIFQRGITSGAIGGITHATVVKHRSRGEGVMTGAPNQDFDFLRCHSDWSSK